VANVELLKKTLQHIKSKPELWGQGQWFRTLYDNFGKDSGTAGCFAGWACLLSGYERAPKDGGGQSTLNVVKHGSLDADNVRHVAVNQLGISYDQADRLFDPDNSLEDLESIVISIIAVQ
jgi:hypothetical protein